MTQNIEFRLFVAGNKTDIYNVIATKDSEILGDIRWYGPWRQYVFEPRDNTTWSADCLLKVHGFIVGLMDARKLEGETMKKKVRTEDVDVIVKGVNSKLPIGAKMALIQPTEEWARTIQATSQALTGKSLEEQKTLMESR